MSAPAAAGGGASVESSQESQVYCEVCNQDFNNEDIVGSCAGDEWHVCHIYLQGGWVWGAVGGAGALRAGKGASGQWQAHWGAVESVCVPREREFA
jgi:hypothetical protein